MPSGVDPAPDSSSIHSSELVSVWFCGGYEMTLGIWRTALSKTPSGLQVGPTVGSTPGLTPKPVDFGPLLSLDYVVSDIQRIMLCATATKSMTAVALVRLRTVNRDMPC